MTTTKILTTILTAAALFSAADAMQQIPQQNALETGAVQRTGSKGWKRFTSEEDDLLRQLVQQFGKDWKRIAEYFPNKNNNQIGRRWREYLCYDSQTSNKNWTEEENKKLTDLFGVYGKNWKTIAKFFPNRNLDAVRQRWNRIARQVAQPAPAQPAPELLTVEDGFFDMFVPDEELNWLFSKD